MSVLVRLTHRNFVPRHPSNLGMTTSKTVRLFMVVAGLALTTANAQTGTDTSSTATNSMTTTRTDDRRGFDWGWLGLLGLAGLLGLRRPNVVTETRSGTGTNRI